MFYFRNVVARRPKKDNEACEHKFISGNIVSDENHSNQKDHMCQIFFQGDGLIDNLSANG
ncbi:hypothetical protein D3C76_316950 [compost metagenome]